MHYSQPMPAIINTPVGGKALLRLVSLSVTEYHTLAFLGIPMNAVGFNAKLLSDQAGLNTEFYTNSITLGGGESLDVVLDASDASCGSTGCATTLYPAGRVFYRYTPNFRYRTDDCSRVSCVGWQRIPTGHVSVQASYLQNRAQELLPRNAAPSSLDRIADNVKLVGGETIGFMILGHFSHPKVQPDRAANEKHPSRSEWACVAAGLQRGQQVRRT
jgi:hypothetical protein